MIIRDLCGEAKDCLQKEIDGKESVASGYRGFRMIRRLTMGVVAKQ